jgi:hypothetical protein
MQNQVTEEDRLRCFLWILNTAHKGQLGILK